MEAYLYNNAASTVELTVPAERSMLLIVRMTAAGVLSRAGLTLDAVDDVKMAVEEACNCLMMQPNPCESIRLCFRRVPDGMSLSVQGVGRHKDAQAEPDPCAQEIVRCVLESMVDTVILDEEDGGLKEIKMVKCLPSYGEIE